MKKLFIIISLLFCAVVVYGQPVVNRAGPANTVSDARLQAQYNMLIPRYADTTAALVQKGVDSSGAIIYTYNPATYWVRVHAPSKHWQEVGQKFGEGDNLFTSDRLVDMSGYNMSQMNGNWCFNCLVADKRITIGSDIDSANTMYIYAPDGSTAFIEGHNNTSIGISAGSLINFRPNIYSSAGQIIIFPNPSNYVTETFYSGAGEDLGEIGVNILDPIDSVFEFFIRPIDASSAGQTTELTIYGPKRLPETDLITDSTGYDVAMIQRSDGKLRRIPSNLIGGSGGGGGGGGISAVYAGVGLGKTNDSTLYADTNVVSTRAWRQKGFDSLNTVRWPFTNISQIGANTILANPTSSTADISTVSLSTSQLIGRGSSGDISPITIGNNLVMTGTILSAVSDTNWVYLSSYGTPNDGLSDTAAIKAALATGKNVYVTPGVWLWDGYRATVNKGQIVRGYGLNSVIQFTKDTCDVLYLPNDSSIVDYISFRGKGRGTYPGGETFTYSNAIYISGNSNIISNCYFTNVKGSAVTSWASSTIYNNAVYFCSGDSNTIGIYLVLNSEYGKYQDNSFQHGRAGFVERCSGNNKWDMLNGDYCDYGFRLKSPGGCNGDHGSVSNSTFNHCINAIDISEVTNEYLFINVKDYFGNVNIGTTDTARQVIFEGCVFSTCTITTTKAKNCKITNGAFGPNNSPAVTIVGTTGIEYCNIANSIYQNTTCGGGASLTNPMTTAEDIIKGGVSGTPTRLGVGADGTFLGVSGGVLQYLSLSGGGDVFKVGTPVNNQVGVWTGNGTIEGDANFTWDASNLAITGTESVSTSVTSPLFIGTSSTTAGIIMKASTGNASGANPAFILNAGNNGATQMFRVDHNGTFGFGSNPSSSFKFFIVSLGATSSTGPFLVRNSSSQNILQSGDNGDWKFGNQSTTTSVSYFLNRNSLGNGLTPPTAWVHLGAGTTAAQTAPLKFTSGTSMTTPEAGAVEYTTDDLFITIATGTARKRLLMADPVGGLTSGRVTFATTNGRATDASNFTFNGTRLSPNYITLAAGTTGAGTTPLLLTSGPLTTTPEAGGVEYNNAHYQTNNAVNRYALGGPIADFFTDANNVGTGETDLYSYTTKANTLGSDGEKITAEFYGVTTGSATATRTLQIYFGGVSISNSSNWFTGVDAIGLEWKVTVIGIRESSSVIRWSVTYIIGSSGVTSVTDVNRQTGLTLSGTNILKITGQAGGTGAGSDQILGKFGSVSWYGAANN